MKWPLYSLDELGSVNRGRSRHRPRNAIHLYNGKYPFIQTGDVKASNLYITEYTQTYNEIGLEQSKLWPTGTLCITIAANIAETGILSFPACFPDSIIGFIAYDGKSDVRYIKYYFDIFQKNFQQISQGATQDNLSAEKLLGLKIPAPCIVIQKKIGDILSHYDDLIENNLKRIKLLEEMAQITYEEWFVRMRFPGHETTPINQQTGLPEGWKKDVLGKHIKFIKGKKLDNFFSEKGDGLVKIMLLDSLETGVFKYTLPNKHVSTNRGDLVMCMDGARSSYVFYAEEGVVGSTMAKIETKTLPESLLYLFFKSILESLQTNNTGAAIPHANKAFINNIEFTIAAPSVLALWSKKISTIYTLVWNLRDQNQRLREARDILLPRLMTGIIDAENYDPTELLKDTA